MKRIPEMGLIVLALAVLACQLPSLLFPAATQTPAVPTALIPTGQPTASGATRASASAEIDAEISLPDVAVSADGSVIRICVAVLNHGGTFTLSTRDVSLLQQDATPLAMVSSEPALPEEIAAGAEEVFYFVFPRPTTPTATLKVLTTEYTIEGY